MCLALDIHGISVQLTIRGYEPSNEEYWGSQWCKSDFSFRSGEWLDYHKEDEEVLLSEEVEKIKDTLSDLLQNGTCITKKISCMEPDFDFIFHPKRDLKDDPDYKHLPPELALKDISVEWSVRFWNDGLTDNSLTVTLDRENITAFWNYLYDVVYSKYPCYQDGNLIKDSHIMDDFYQLIRHARKIISSNNLQKRGEEVVAALSTHGNLYHKIVSNPYNEESQLLDAKSFVEELTKNQNTQLDKIVCFCVNAGPVIPPHYFTELIRTANSRNSETKILLENLNSYKINTLSQISPPGNIWRK